MTKVTENDQNDDGQTAISTVGAADLTYTRTTINTLKDANGRKMETRMKQQLKTALVAVPTIASITPTGQP